MSRCIEKIKHSCGKFSLQVFEKDDGKIDGYCFYCCKPVDNPYGDKPEGYRPPAAKLKTPEEIKAEIEEIGQYKVTDIPSRKLKEWAIDYFKVKVGVSEEDGTTPSSVYFPYYKDRELIGYKCRILDPKKQWAIGTTKGAEFFGWNQALGTGAKRLIITEGEFDAIAMYQICKDNNRGTAYEALNPAVVSLVNGVMSAKRDIVANMKTIKEYFKEVVIVFDMDEPGRKAAEEVAKLFPEVIIANLPGKDINECLMEGRAKAAYNAVMFNAQKPKNTRIVCASDLHEEAKVPAQFGLSWPWKAVTAWTRGLRFGETIYMGAAQKMGKSEVVNVLAAHFIKEHGLKVFLAKPEENNKKTYKLVAGKLEGNHFHDPNIPFDEEAYERAGPILKDKLFLLNLYQHVGWESLKADIRQAAANGCKVVMIDPITNLTNGMNAADANVKLQEIAQELSAMALDLDVVIFIFCHLRNPDNGPPHERGGEVLSSQFAGSRAMARSCNYMFGIEGNRDPNLTPEERNIRTLVLLEDREFGEVGRMKLYWNKANGLFTEIN